MSVAIIRGDAAQIPLPDESVDLVCCSPPYFGLRSYTDNGAHYKGQIGSESTPQEWLDALLTCTKDWMRVLKPEGSIFINLGDKYGGSDAGSKAHTGLSRHGSGSIARRTGKLIADLPSVGAPKSLLGLPWRYALACTDQLGLILRRDIIWAKPNGLPESVTDRCRSAHEYVFHLVRQPRYYSAVDEIREPHLNGGIGPSWEERKALGQAMRHGDTNGGASLGAPGPKAGHPLGKLPGSVWSIPSQPLTVPASVGVDHFAAFPVELPRRIVLGWSPPGVCVECGQGRRPVVDKHKEGGTGHINFLGRPWQEYVGRSSPVGENRQHWHPAAIKTTNTIAGYACACTTDLPGSGRMSGTTRNGGPAGELPPTRPAVVLDPFAGTGTTLLAAAAYGRHAIGIDRSADYCRLATWRVNDPGERAKAMQVPKPPPVPDGMEALF